MIYLIDKMGTYSIVRAYCKANEPIVNYISTLQYAYVGEKEDAGVKFSTSQIVDKTTSNDKEFAMKKWAEYLI